MPVPNEWISKENANGGPYPSNEDQGNGLGWEFYDQNWPNQAQGSYMQDSQMQNPQTPIPSSYGQVSSPYGLASADYGPALDDYGSVPDSYGLAPASYGLAPGSYWQTQGPPAGRRPNSPYGIAPQPYQQWGFVPPHSRKTSSLAICSLAFSLCGWILSLCGWIPAWLVLLPAGIICGHCALYSIQRTGKPGVVLACAGSIFGYLGLISVPPIILALAHR